MKYNSYHYLWPVRPENKIAPSGLAEIERLGWLGQAKMDGDCIILYVSPDRVTNQRGRHGDQTVTRWRPGHSWNKFAETFPGDGWYAIEAELLNDRAAGAKDTVYMHDLLVDNGDYLVGKTYAERYRRLQALCSAVDGSDATPEHCAHGNGVWLATCVNKGLRSWYDRISKLPRSSGIEGLVLKDPNARLRPCSRATSNSHGMAKCRIPKANLSF